MTKYEYLISKKDEIIEKLKADVSKKDIVAMYNVSVSVFFKFLKEENISINSLNKYSIGQQIENFTLIKKCEKGWLIRCTCGTEKEISTSNIKKMKSCGCLRNELARERNRNKAENLAGKIFGSVHVIKLVDASISMYNWYVYCDLCGKYKTMETAAIKQAKSCGCRMHGIVKDRTNVVEGVASDQDYINVLREVDKKYKKGRAFICICPSCNNEKILHYTGVIRCINNKIKWTCYDCSVRDGEKASERTARKKMAINNTSGYIGVSLIKTKGVYVSQLKYKGLITIIGDKYEPNEDGLLQGAIDRDLYIIEHNLPHRRNFADEELLIAIEKRTKSELNLFAQI